MQHGENHFKWRIRHAAPTSPLTPATGKGARPRKLRHHRLRFQKATRKLGHRPSGTTCDSPGQRPGITVKTNPRPEGAELFQGLKTWWDAYPGRCPGLSPCAPLGLEKQAGIPSEAGGAGPRGRGKSPRFAFVSARICWIPAFAGMTNRRGARPSRTGP